MLGSDTTGIEFDDGRVVPGGDRTTEDLGQHVGVDDELLDTVEVEGDRDGPEDNR